MARVKAEKFMMDDEPRNQFISNTLVPLFNKHLADESKHLGRTCNSNVESFMNLWASGHLLFLTAWEQDKVVGFLIGYKTQPTFTALPTLCIERWDGADDKVVNALFDYAISCADIINAVSVEVIDTPWRKSPVSTEYNQSLVRTINTLTH